MNPVTYVKNVGKSFGYIARDVFKEYNPVLADYVEDTKRFTEDLYASVKELKETADPEKSLVKKTKTRFKESKDLIIKSFKEDLKSGNWHNQARIDEYDDEMYANSMSDFEFDDFDDMGDEMPSSGSPSDDDDDFGFDFNPGDTDIDDDFGDLEDETNEVSNNIKSAANRQISAQKNSAKYIASSIRRSSKAAAISVSNANIEGFNHIGRIQQETSTAVMGTIDRSTAVINNSLVALNTNLAAVTQLSGSLANHLQNSQTYFTKSTELQSQIVDLLTEIRDATVPKKNERDYRQASLEDIISGSGALSLTSIRDVLTGKAEQFKEQIESIKSTLDSMGLLNFDKDIAKSPIAWLIKNGVTKLIPKDAKNAMKEFDDYLSGFARAALGKLQDKDFGFFGNMIKNILIPESQYTRRIQTGNYEKGKVDWDGISRRALIDVIPDYLSNIESALTGKDPRIYDYDAGRWTSRKKLKEDLAGMETSAARSATYELLEMMSGTLRELVRDNQITKDQSRAMTLQLQDYVTKGFHEGFGTGFLNYMDDDFDYKSYGLSKETWQFLRNTTRSAERNKKSHIVPMVRSNVMMGQESYGKRMNRYAEEGSVYGKLFDDSEEFSKNGAGSLFGTDDYGNDLWFYQRGLYQYTQYIAENLNSVALVAGGGGTIRSKRSKFASNTVNPTAKPKPIVLKPLEVKINKNAEEEEKDREKQRLDDSIKNINMTDAEFDKLVKIGMGDDEDKVKLKITDQKLKDYKLMRELKISENGQFTPLDEGYDSELESKLDEWEKQNDRIQKGLNKFKNNPIIRTFSNLQQQVANLLHVPTEITERYLNGFEISMNRFLNGGDSGSGQKGIGQMLKDDIGDMLKKASDKMDDIFGPFSKYIKGIGRFFAGVKDPKDDQYKGGILSGLVNVTRDQLGKAKSWIKDTMFGKTSTRSSYGSQTDDGDLQSPETAARGKRVTKTGMVAVSEGEMIIPAEYNPFYHGKINKAEQERNELAAVENFYGMYSKGSKRLKKKKHHRSIKEVISGSNSSNVEESMAKTEDASRKDTDQVIEDAKNRIKQGSETLSTAFTGLIDRFLMNGKDPEKEASTVKKTIGDMWFAVSKDGNPKENLGAAAAGALIGGGTGLLTGGLVGPLLGAGIGAGAGLLIRSKELQKIVFGYTDEDGKEVKGLLPHKILDFVKEKVPGILKWGGGGGIASMILTGNPLLGMFIGAGSKFALGNESIMNTLFGEQTFDENGKSTGRKGGLLLSSKTQKKLKEAFPMMGAGALAGAIAGPFGLVGNVMLGSALGYASSTDKFKNWLFGEEDPTTGKRKGGLVGLIKDNFFTPLLGIFGNLTESIGKHIRNSFTNLGKHLRNRIAKGLGIQAAPIKRLAGKVVRGADKVTRGGIRGVGRVIKSVQGATSKHNLKKGYNVYNAKENRYMTAAERMEYREQRGMNTKDKYSAMDEILSGATTKSQLKEIKAVADKLKDPTKELDIQNRSNIESAIDYLGDLTDDKYNGNDEGRKSFRSASKKIVKALKNGDSEKAAKLAQGLNISDEEREKLNGLMGKAADSTDKLRKAREDAQYARNQVIQGSKLDDAIKDKLAKRNLSEKDMQALSDKASDEMKGRKDLLSDKEKQEMDLMDAIQKATVETIPDYLDKILAALKGPEEKDQDDSKKSDEDESKKEEEGKDKSSEKDEKEPKNNEDVPTDTGLPKGPKLPHPIKSLKGKVNGFIGGIKDKVNSYKNYDPLKIKMNNLGYYATLQRKPKEGATRINSEGVKEIYQNGEWGVDNTDSESNEKIKEKNSLRDTIKEHLPKISAGVGLLGGAFGKFKDLLFGNKKKGKEGIFTKLGKKLFGEDGFLPGIFNFITGTNIGTTVRTALSTLKGGLAGMMHTVIPLALISWAASGKFDEFAKKLHIGYGDNDKESDIYYNQDTGETINVQLDENGKPVMDQNGNYTNADTGETVDAQKTGVRSGDTASFSEKFVQNAVRGAITGKGSVAGLLVKKSLNSTKTGSKLLKKAGDLVANGKNIVKGANAMDEFAVQAATGPFIETVMSGVRKFTSVLKKVKIFKGLGDQLDEMGEELASKVATSLATGAGKKIANIVSTAVVWLKVGMIIIDFTTGFQDAKSTFGIIDEPTFGQKIVSGLIRALKNFIPVIGSLIPDSLLMDIFCKFLGPALGFDLEDLNNKRDTALKTAQEAGYDTVQEYLKANGDYTWTEKLGNKVKTLKQKATAGITNLRNDVAAHGGYKGYLKDKTLGLVEKGKGALTSLGNKGKNLVTSIGKKTGSVVKGVVTPITDKILNITKMITDERKYINDLMHNPDSNWKDIFKIPEDADDPLGGISNAVRIVTRITTMPAVLINAIGSRIKKAFTTIKDAAVSNVTSLFKNDVEIGKKVVEGDPIGLWNLEFQDNEEDPAAGLTKGLFTIQKIFNFPRAGISWVGHKVKDVFVNVATAAKDNFMALAKSDVEIGKKVIDGDPIGLWNLEFQDNEEDPAAGLTKGIFAIQKLFNMPRAGISWVGHKIKDSFDNMIEKDKSNRDALTDALTKVKEVTKQGDLVGIWTNQLKLDSGDPLAFVWEASYNINRLFQSIMAIFYKIADPVKEVVDKVKDGVANGWNFVKDKAGNIITNVKDTASNVIQSGWNKVTSFVAGSGSGFVSQTDSRFANKKLSGGRNVAEFGCGPAAAVMAVGNSGSMDNAIRTARNYQTNGGTDIAFFNDFYQQNGRRAEYYNDTGSIVRSIGAGGPTVLMGRDPYNTSKARSPFGPNNHYVVANGFDRNGNVIVSDPEMKGVRKYSPRILKNVGVGIGMGAGGSRRRRMFGIGAGASTGLRVDDTTTAIWGFLRNHGYSAAAAAGIMGNLQAESGCSPSRKQYSGGPGRGLAQWEEGGGRFEKIVALASSKGRDWTDLECQLVILDQETRSMSSSFCSNYKKISPAQFMQMKNPDEAAEWFLRVFERPKNPEASLKKRVEYARYYFKEFADKTDIDVASLLQSQAAMATASSSAYQSGTIENAMKSTGSSSGGNVDILGTITGTFSKIFNAIFGLGGNDSSSEASSSGGDTYAQDYLNNVGDVGSTSFANGNAPVDHMKNILGQISYDMNGPRNPEAGSADCSSTVQWAIKKSTGIDIGGSTLAQYNNEHLKVLGYNNGAPLQTLPSNIMPNDVLFFSRNGKSYTQGRPDRVGHVGLYLGNGQMIDHGSGMGPKIKDIKLDQGNGDGLIKVSRLLGPDGMPYNFNYEDGSAPIAVASGMNGKAPITKDRFQGVAASGSGVLNQYFDDNKLELMGNRRLDAKRQAELQRNYSLAAGASSAGNQEVVRELKRSNMMLETMVKLIQSLIDLLTKVSTNSDHIAAIRDILVKIVANGAGAADSSLSESAAKMAAMALQNSNSNDMVSKNLSDLRDTVNQILAS